MLHLRGFRGSRRGRFATNLFASVCSARSLKTQDHLSGEEFAAIRSITDRVLCQKCINLFDKRYDCDPQHPELDNVEREYNLTMLEHI